MRRAAEAVLALGPRWVADQGRPPARGEAGRPADRRHRASTGSGPRATTTGTPTAPAAPWPRRSPPSSPSARTCPRRSAAKEYVTGAIAAGFPLGARHRPGRPRLAAGPLSGPRARRVSRAPEHGRPVPREVDRPSSADRVRFGRGLRRRYASARDLAGLDARGADVEPLRRPPDHGTHALDVGVPATRGTAVRVRDAVAEARPLAADVAVGSHGSLQRLQMHLRGKARESPGQPEQHTTATPVQRNYHGSRRVRPSGQARRPTTLRCTR